MPFDEALSNATDAFARKVPRLPGEPNATSEAAIDEALRDLTLPSALSTSLGVLFEELGYPMTCAEIPERFGTKCRTFTVAERCDTDVRHLLHIPKRILDTADGEAPVAKLGFAIPAGTRAFVLSEDLDLPADYWKRVPPFWESMAVEAKFVAWRYVTRDLEAKVRQDQLESIAELFDLEANGAPPASGEPGADAGGATEPPRVFISYSWDSDAHKEQVLRLANWLVDHGVDTSLDQWVTPPPPHWAQWCDDEIARATFVLVVCTETYRRRFERKEPASPDGEPVGLGATWESQIITLHLYESGGKQTKFIPVVLSKDDLEHIPRPLRFGSRYNLSIDDEWKSLYGLVTQQYEHVRPALGTIVELDEVGPPPRPAAALPPGE